MSKIFSALLAVLVLSACKPVASPSHPAGPIFNCRMTSISKPYIDFTGSHIRAAYTVACRARPRAYRAVAYFEQATAKRSATRIWTTIPGGPPPATVPPPPGGEHERVTTPCVPGYRYRLSITISGVSRRGNPSSGVTFRSPVLRVVSCR